MKRLILIILFSLIPFSIASQTEPNILKPIDSWEVDVSSTTVIDSTRLKSYEAYKLNVTQEITKTEKQILQLQEYLLQLRGAQSAFEAIINDEKKRLDENIKK